ncbi:metal-dependent hydrolase [Halobacteriales archaeon Cl-PHB]
MASTVVHLAFAGMVAAALLGEAFDRRSLAVVLAVTAVPDLDSFLPLVSSVGHRAALHTLLIPVGLGVALWYDVRFRPQSVVRDRWGRRGVRIAWVSLLSYAVAGIGIDLFSTGGANALYPVVDQFYIVQGKLELSSKRGIVQTFVEWGQGGVAPAPTELGSSENVTVTTGIDPGPQPQAGSPDRIFPIARAGWQLHILLVGTAVTLGRLFVPRELGDD